MKPTKYAFYGVLIGSVCATLYYANKTVPFMNQTGEKILSAGMTAGIGIIAWGIYRYIKIEEI